MAVKNEKQFKKLSRLEILELLYSEMKKNEELAVSVTKLEARLAKAECNATVFETIKLTLSDITKRIEKLEISCSCGNDELKSSLEAIEAAANELISKGNQIEASVAELPKSIKCEAISPTTPKAPVKTELIEDKSPDFKPITSADIINKVLNR